jgi:outer membrane protein
MIRLALILLLVDLHLAFAAPVNLQSAFSSAVAKNELMAEQERTVLQAEERYTQAKGNLLPTISGSASYLVQDRPNDPAAAEFFPVNQPNAALTLRQPIFRGTREYAGIRQLGHLSDAQKFVRDRAWLDLYNEVSRSFYALASAQQELKQLRAERELFKERIVELKARVNAGTSSETDLLTSQASEAEVASQIEAAQGRLVAADESFAYLTGVPRKSELDLGDQYVPDSRPLEAELKNLESRPEIRAAKERYEASDAAVQVAWGQHLPSIDFIGNYYLKRPAGIFDGVNWDAQAQLTLPIFSGGIIQSQVRDAALSRENSGLELARLRRDAEREVRTLYGAYEAEVAAMRALARSSEIAERNYNLLKRDYRRGLTRNLDVLQALTSSQQSQRALTRARLATLNTWNQLQTASGRIVSERGRQ